MTTSTCVSKTSGWGIDLGALKPDTWTDRDLALSLSRVPRWGGRSKWDQPLSVAQHSLLVLVICEQVFSRTPLTAGQALHELLHEADSAFVGRGQTRSLLPHLGGRVRIAACRLREAVFGEPRRSRAMTRMVSERLREAILVRYRLGPQTRADTLLHRQADRMATACKSRHVLGWSREETRNKLGSLLTPLRSDPMPSLDGFQPWEPWPPEVAAALFLAKLRELTDEGYGKRPPGCMKAVIRREQTIRTLAADFARLPPAKRRRCTHPPTGTSLCDTLVHAEAHDGSECVEGIVVGGERDEGGAWDFDAEFAVFTTEGELLTCHGYNCHVDIQ